MLSKLTLLFVAISFAPFLVMGQETAINLEKYQWENRLLLVFSPTPHHNNYQTQLQMLESDTAGLGERDVLVFHILEDGNGEVGEQPISAAEAERLARSYKINPAGFTVLLIGKDGTEKLRQQEPLEVTELFSIIDAMPMRQREMRDQ